MYVVKNIEKKFRATFPHLQEYRHQSFVMRAGADLFDFNCYLVLNFFTKCYIFVAFRLLLSGNKVWSCDQEISIFDNEF
jgi:hypothetical protein